MKHLRLLLLLALLPLRPFQALAQEFTIDRVNAVLHPTITVTISATGSLKPDKDNLKVSEDNHPVTFTVSPVAATGRKSEGAAAPASAQKAVCFLIETSAFTSFRQIHSVKGGIARQLGGLPAGTPVDICYYTRSRPGGAMAHVSAEFTSDYPALVHDMNDRITGKTDTTPRADLFKALYECIEFVAGRTNLPAQKEIILISTGNNNGGSPISRDECTARAAEAGIVVHGIGLRSNNVNAADNVKLAASAMKGQYRAAASESEMDKALDDLLQGGNNSHDAASPATTGNQYEIRYNSPSAVNNGATVSISLGNVTQTRAYAAAGDNASAVSDKKGAKTSAMLPWIIGGVLLAGLLILGLARASGKKRAAAARETARREEAERAQQAARPPQVKESENSAAASATLFTPPQTATDLHRTVVTGMKRMHLIIIDNGQQQSYPLTAAGYTIGRNPDNTIVIPNPTVSGRHATLSMEQGAWQITDNGSTNGTYINGQRITAPAELRPGMQLAFGQVACSVEIN